MPSTLNHDDLIRQLNWRYAVKKFDPSRKIPDATWRSLEQAVTLSPSSYGLQPWRFYVISDAALRQKLRAASWNQPQITEASHLLLFARKRELGQGDVDRYIDRIATVRQAQREALSGFRDMMLGAIGSPETLGGGSIDAWTSRQVYIALGVFLASAAVLGVDACPMEGFDPAAYNEILGLPAEGFAATVVATAGYRAADDALAAAPKVRFDSSDVIRRR